MWQALKYKEKGAFKAPFLIFSGGHLWILKPQFLF
jgi:hypothetical protein